MGKKLTAPVGAISGGIAGVIIGIAIFALILPSGESLAIVDPGGSATAIVIIAAAAIAGALIGWLISRSRG